MSWVADALALAGAVIITFGVIGVYRFPDVYMKVHASSKIAVAGVALIALAILVGGDVKSGLAALVVSSLLFVTAPVAAHAIATTAAERGDPMRTAHTFDESQLALDTDDPPANRPGTEQIEDEGPRGPQRSSSG